MSSLYRSVSSPFIYYSPSGKNYNQFRGTYIIHLLSPCFRPWLCSILSEKLPPVFELLSKTDSFPGRIIVKNPLEEKHNIIPLGGYELLETKVCTRIVLFGVFDALGFLFFRVFIVSADLLATCRRSGGMKCPTVSIELKLR
jgi:hypothetical protein